MFIFQNDKFLMDLLDGETPAAYRQAIEVQIMLNPKRAHRFKTYHAIQKLMHSIDGQMSKTYQESKKRLLYEVISTSRNLRKRHWYFHLAWIPAALLFVLFFVAHPTTTRQIFQQYSSDIYLTNSAEFSEYVPYITELVADDLTTNDTVNLRISIQDMEQLFILLEKARNLNDSIDNINIHIPSEIDGFEFLGESQLIHSR